jgi:hypothetical protein
MNIVFLCPHVVEKVSQFAGISFKRALLWFEYSLFSLKGMLEFNHHCEVLRGWKLEQTMVLRRAFGR